MKCQILFTLKNDNNKIGLSSAVDVISALTHFSLESPKRIKSKQCRLQNAASDQGLHCLQKV